MARPELEDDYSVGNAALFLHVSERTISDYILDGRLPNAYVDSTSGRRHRIPFSDLKNLKQSGSKSLDERVREAAITWLEQRTSDGAEALHTSDLDDFQFEGKPFRLKDITKGIRKPKNLDAALSITTVYREPGKERPYRDEVGPDGLLRYKWEGEDPDLYTNRGLRRAMELRLPIIWFFGVGQSQFQAIFPVYLVAEEPEKRQFVVDIDAANNPAVFNAPGVGMESISIPKGYSNRVARVRLHQRVFRSSVLRAYESRCAVCNLKHAVLLDAAHIIPDRDEEGIASVENGLALCKIHHAAFDANILGISPDLQVHIREDILEEVDGPMLKHGLQERHRQGLMSIPKKRAEMPNKDFLARSYDEFLKK
ncbi:putative restriction endonuclease [Arthrobacter alpinus]|uniref:Putative restriction endonuclease n=1 Tax=Arthrobacter alpinus TaxID=656366 RepID=A0A1H5KZG1_9MICC|nr:HNH endonuclease [Arthrobacter alpinus]SEE70249.1 putative restriction endonuclease [Arthrobacter alpinus]